MSLKTVNGKKMKFLTKKIALIAINHYVQNVGVKHMILARLIFILIKN